MTSRNASYNNLPVPADGGRIELRDGKFIVPDRPIIPFVEGDGTGRDIWKASRRIFDAAVPQGPGPPCQYTAPTCRRKALLEKV